MARRHQLTARALVAAATLLDGIRGTIFTDGDNAYSDGSTTDYVPGSTFTDTGSGTCH